MLQPQCNVKTTAWPADQYKLLNVNHEIGHVSTEGGVTTYTNLNEDGVYFRVRPCLALLMPPLRTASPSPAAKLRELIVYTVVRGRDHCLSLDH